MPEGHHGGTAAILGAVGGYRPATDGIRRGFESPAHRDKAAIKREESEARFDYPEREQARLKVSGYKAGGKRNHELNELNEL